jgi:hypothetical protein
MSYYTPVALFDIVKIYSEIDRLNDKFESDLVSIINTFLIIEKKQPIDYWISIFPVFYEKLLEKHSLRVYFLDRREFWSLHFKSLIDKFDISEFHKTNEFKKLDNIFTLFYLRTFFTNIFWFLRHKLETQKVERVIQFLIILKDFTLNLELKPIDEIIYILKNKIDKL